MVNPDRAFQELSFDILLLFLGPIGAEIQQFDHRPVSANRVILVSGQ